MTVEDVQVTSLVDPQSKAARISSGSEVRDDLISAAKHDLRNPIASIQAFSELLLNHGDNNLTNR